MSSVPHPLLADPALPPVGLADVAAWSGLAALDVDALAQLGAAALDGGQPARAVAVFGLLVQLQPRVAAHRLHLAVGHREAGDAGAAIAALDALVALGTPADVAGLEDLVRALVLRAELVVQRDPASGRAAAADDLAVARLLVAEAPDVQRVLQSAGLL